VPRSKNHLMIHVILHHCRSADRVLMDSPWSVFSVTIWSLDLSANKIIQTEISAALVF
jgi:hypothetical protein